jgi:hypothetical protein
MPLRDLARLIARRHDPDILFDSGGVGGGIRIGMAQELQIAAAHEDQRLAIGGELQLPDILAIVVSPGGQPYALKIGCSRVPDIAGAALVEQPGNRAAAGGRGDFGRERSGQHLFQSECTGGKRTGASQGGQKKMSHSNSLARSGAFGCIRAQVKVAQGVALHGRWIHTALSGINCAPDPSGATSAKAASVIIND